MAVQGLDPLPYIYMCEFSGHAAPDFLSAHSEIGGCPRRAVPRRAVSSEVDVGTRITVRLPGQGLRGPPTGSECAIELRGDAA